MIKFIKFIIFIAILYWFRSFYVIPLWFFSISLIIKLIEYSKNIQYIQGTDLLFLWEMPNTPNTIVLSIIMDQISFEKIRTIFEERVLVIKRMRQSVVEVFNEKFWKEHSKEETLNQISKIDTLRTYEDIISYKQSLFGKKLRFDKPLWEIYFQEHFDNNKSLLFLKIHHSITDGGGTIYLLSSLTDNVKLVQEYKSKLPNISYIKKILLILGSPIFTFLTFPKLDNKIENPLTPFSGPSTAQFKISESKEYDLDLLKNSLKGFAGATINDLCWTVLSRAIKSVIEQNRNKVNDISSVSNVIGLMGVSYRTQEIDDAALGNESAGCVVQIKMNNMKIESHLSYVKSVLKQYKKKLFFKGSSYLGKFMINYLMDQDSLLKFGEKAFERVGFVYSNIIGPKERIYIEGREVYEINPVLPHGNFSFSLITFSYRNKLRFCLNTDVSYRSPIDEIIKEIENDLDEFIKLYV
jgi:hypothetical protein